MSKSDIMLFVYYFYERDIVRIGIDLDHTINENDNTALFFSMLTHAFKDKSKIYIITNRHPSDRRKTAKELSSLGIHYDHLCITAEKSQLIMDEGITVYFDDTDETFLSLPESVLVFKTRESGNFDFDKHRWIYGNKTGINIDDK